MKEFTAFERNEDTSKKSVKSDDHKEGTLSKQETRRADVRAIRAQNLRDKVAAHSAPKPVGLNIRITSDAPEKPISPSQYKIAEDTSYNRKQGRLNLSMAQAQQLQLKEQEEGSSSTVSMSSLEGHSIAVKIAMLFGIVFSAAWLAFCVSYLFVANIAFDPAGLGIFLGSILAPLALYWMILSSVMRRGDVQRYMQVMRDDVSLMLGTHDKASHIVTDDIERLNAQSMNVSNISQNILDQISSARSDFDDQLHDFSAASHKVELQMSRLGDVLSEKSAALSMVSGNADDVALALTQGTDKILQATTRAEQSAHSIREDLRKSYDGLNQSVSNVSTNLKVLSDGVGDQTRDISNTVERASEDLERLINLVKEQIDDLERVSVRTVETMVGSSESMQYHKQAMNQSALAIAQQSKDMASTINASVVGFDGAVSAAIENTRGLEERIEERTQQLHAMASSIGDEVTVIEDASMRAADILRDSISHLGDEAQSIGQELHDKAVMFSSVATHSMASMSDMGDALSGHSKQISTVTQKLVEDSQRAQGALDDAQKALCTSANDLGGRMKDTIYTTRLYGKELEEMVSGAFSASIESARKMDDVVSTLNTTIDKATQDAIKAAYKVERSQVLLKDETARLGDMSDAAQIGIERAAMQFLAQSQALQDASKSIEVKAKSAQDIISGHERNAFLSSAKFVIEGLYSLSVDLSRMLEGGVSEKTWSAFNHGDVSAFTRRMIDMSGRVSLEKAQAKFEKDPDFRVYVLRYISQFEGMYKEAIDNDHASILSATLGTSEIGKLYGFLCMIASKSSVLITPRV